MRICWVIISNCRERWLSNQRGSGVISLTIGRWHLNGKYASKAYTKFSRSGPHGILSTCIYFQALFRNTTCLSDTNSQCCCRMCSHIFRRQIAEVNSIFDFILAICGGIPWRKRSSLTSRFIIAISLFGLRGGSFPSPSMAWILVSSSLSRNVSLRWTIQWA